MQKQHYGRLLKLLCTRIHLNILAEKRGQGGNVALIPPGKPQKKEEECLKALAS